jgi:hypothetical protein
LSRTGEARTTHLHEVTERAIAEVLQSDGSEAAELAAVADGRDHDERG